MLNRELKRLLKKRGVTETTLAKQALVGRAALGLVINGRRRGVQTWPRLANVLTKEEYDVAKEFADGELARLEAAEDAGGGEPKPDSLKCA